MKRTELEKLGNMSAALRSMAHPMRLKILIILGDKKKLSVNEIQRLTGLTQSMTSQHIIAMKAQGILASHRKRNKVIYSIANPEVLKILSCMSRCAEHRAGH